MQRAKKGSSKTDGVLKPALLENKPPFFHFFLVVFLVLFLCSLLQELGFPQYIYIYIYIPVVPARGEAEVALGIYYIDLFHL